jgi:uncharacterized damage-inducible protein DinB
MEALQMETQPEPTLVEFIRYNQWANQELLAACKDLTQDQLTASIPGTYGSILDTFGHILRAEADYLERITGSSPQPLFNWEPGPGIAEMTAYAAQVGEAVMDTVQRVPPTQNVHEEENGFTVDYQARQLYMQLVNHGISHRTDITTFLSRQGLPVPELDGWGYMWAHPERFAAREGKL